MTEPDADPIHVDKPAFEKPVWKRDEETNLMTPFDGNGKKKLPPKNFADGEYGAGFTEEEKKNGLKGKKE